MCPGPELAVHTGSPGASGQLAPQPEGHGPLGWQHFEVRVMLCGSRIPVRMRMSSVCLTEKGRTQAAFAPATRAVGRAVWLWSHFTERRQGPAQALVRPGKNGISTQATGHAIKTDDRRGGGRDTRIPTSPPASSLSPQWVDREKGQTPPIRTPGARTAPLRPGWSPRPGPPPHLGW